MIDAGTASNGGPAGDPCPIGRMKIVARAKIDAAKCDLLALSPCASPSAAIDRYERGRTFAQ